MTLDSLDSSVSRRPVIVIVFISNLRACLTASFIFFDLSLVLMANKQSPLLP